MISLLWRGLVLAAAIFVTAHFLSGISYTSYWALAWASLVLAVLNTFVRPLLVLLSIGWVIITFGVFLIVVNALLLMLTSKIVPGFTVDGFWTAFFGSIIISIISGVLGLIGKTKVRVATNTIPPPSFRPPSGKGPVIDI